MRIYIDGLERSGNTFLGGLIGYTFGVDSRPLWSHRLSTLESRDKKYPFIVPVRDVLPSIVSAKIYRDYAWANNMQTNERTGNPDELINRYSEYTQYLIDNDDFFIAPFHEFTTDHNKFVDVVANSFGLKVLQRLSKEEIINKIGENPKVDNPELGNFPRDPASNKEEVTSMFLSEYGEQLDRIQGFIDLLYARYYEKARLIEV